MFLNPHALKTKNLPRKNFTGSRQQEAGAHRLSQCRLSTLQQILINNQESCFSGKG